LIEQAMLDAKVTNGELNEILRSLEASKEAGEKTSAVESNQEIRLGGGLVSYRRHGIDRS